MGCILTISGRFLDLAKALDSVSFPTYGAHKVGDSKRKGTDLHENSGFSADASQASPDDFPRQCRDAEEFLRLYYTQLRRIENVDVAELDFGYDCRIGTGEGGRQIVFQCDYIPASLVKICGELSIGIALTQFPPRNVDRPDL
jgi:hypothetical protein